MSSKIVEAKQIRRKGTKINEKSENKRAEEKYQRSQMKCDKTNIARMHKILFLAKRKHDNDAMANRIRTTCEKNSESTKAHLHLPTLFLSFGSLVRSVIQCVFSLSNYDIIQFSLRLRSVPLRLRVSFGCRCRFVRCRLITIQVNARACETKIARVNVFFVVVFVVATNGKRENETENSRMIKNKLHSFAINMHRECYQPKRNEPNEKSMKKKRKK